MLSTKLFRTKITALTYVVKREYFYDGYHVTNKAFSIKIGKTIILMKQRKFYY